MKLPAGTNTNGVTCEGLLPTIITKGMSVQNKKFTNISIRKNKLLQ